MSTDEASDAQVRRKLEHVMGAVRGPVHQHTNVGVALMPSSLAVVRPVPEMTLRSTYRALFPSCEANCFAAGFTARHAPQNSDENSRTTGLPLWTSDSTPPADLNRRSSRTRRATTNATSPTSALVPAALATQLSSAAMPDFDRRISGSVPDRSQWGLSGWPARSRRVVEGHRLSVGERRRLRRWNRNPGIRRRQLPAPGPRCA